MEPLERYRPIIDDFDAFLAACERPLGNAVRVNTIKPRSSGRSRPSMRRASTTTKPTGTRAS